MTCPICGKELRDDAKFCAGCGWKIPRCPNCGKLLSSQARFCAGCGAQISEAAVPAAPKTVAVEQKKQPTAAAKPKQVTPAKPQKKKQGGWVSVLIAVIVVLALLAGLIWGGIKLLGKLDIIKSPDRSGNHVSRDVDDEDEEDEAETDEESSEEAEAEAVTEPAPEEAPAVAEPETLMPDCVGALCEEAVASLYEMGCSVSVEYIYSDDVAENYVVSQSVPADTDLAAGAEILLTVSKGSGNAPEGYNQKVVVTAAAGSSYGTLKLYDWEDGQWVEKLSCDATVGSNGIADDYGEGRKKSPQGVFKLGVALSANSIPNNSWPYQLMTADDCVVDDVDSSYYNTIQDIDDLPSGVSYDPIGDTLVRGYSNICIYIEHNGSGRDSTNVVAGMGSVITICGRTGGLEPTAGCVDISSSNMTTLMGMLDYSKNPHIEIFAQ